MPEERKQKECRQRIEIKSGDWSLSLLCHQLLGHDGSCGTPDDLDILIKHVIPEVEKRYPGPPLIG